MKEIEPVDYSRAPEVIEKTNFLKAYVSDSPDRDALVNNEAYSINLSLKQAAIGWHEDDTIIPFLQVGFSMDILNRELGATTNSKIIRNVIFSVYELGNLHDLATVTRSIFARLYKDKFFGDIKSADQANHDDPVIQARYKFVTSLFSYGMYLRHLTGGEVPGRLDGVAPAVAIEEPPAEVPYSIITFIKSLNSIDNL